MTDPVADRTAPGWLAAVVAGLPEGVAVFDAEWTICCANPAAVRLLGARTAVLAGRNLWVALPELAGSVFHSHLLHARSVGTPVTWRAFYGPAGRWLTATAELVDGLLHVYLREATEQLTEGPPDAAAGEAAAGANEDADRHRLRFLAEVSESVISTLDTGETAIRLESYLAAADISLSTDLLDRIDELVAPGVTVNPDDNSYGDHTLTPAALRR